MSTPNPLIPQGSLQKSGDSNVRIAVATVLAIHVVFFGGLLLQGCKREAQTGAAVETNNVPAPSSALNYPAIDTNSMFYPSSNALPPESAGTASVAVQQPPTNAAQPDFSSGTKAAAPVQDQWKMSGISDPSSPTTPPTGKEYTVVRGDSYARIAKTQGSTVAALKAANPTIDPARIRPGMKLTVPVSTTTAPAGSASALPVENGSGGNGGNTYTVKSGDNLTRIAKAHGVTVGQLRAANNLQTSMVKVGQKLKIPAGAAGTNSARAASNTTPAPTF